MVVHVRKLRATTPAGRQQARVALAELRSVELTPEEKEILDQFEDFRREHPFRLSSLTDEN